MLDHEAMMRGYGGEVDDAIGRGAISLALAACALVRGASRVIDAAGEGGHGRRIDDRNRRVTKCSIERGSEYGEGRQRSKHNCATVSTRNGLRHDFLLC